MNFQNRNYIMNPIRRKFTIKEKPLFAAQRIYAAFFILCMIGGVCVARDIFVHSESQTRIANGSETEPFKTINDALRIVQDGDTVIVREGIYRESIQVPGGQDDRMVTLKAADGERVILSGAVPVSGWEKYRDNVYTTMLDFKPECLLVAFVEQPIAREPSEGWWTAQAVDGLTIIDTIHLKGVNPDFVGGQAYIWTNSGNIFFRVQVESLDRIKGRLTVIQDNQYMQLGEGDRYALENHPSLIDSPGEWAVQEEGGRFRLYFMPEKPGDLDRVEVPHETRPLLTISDTQHVRISGLDIAATANNGVEVWRSEDVVFSDCIVHNHGFMGMLLRQVNNVTVRNSVFTANSNALVLREATGAIVEENEIAWNTVDGLVVCWNSSDVIVRRNYIHHHLLWGHPDNIQLHNDVKNISFIDNLILAGGQSIMMSGTSDGLVKGNMIVGSIAYSLILSAENYGIYNNTMVFPGYGTMNLRGHNCDVRENVLMTGHPYAIFSAREAGSYTGDYNLFYNTSSSSDVTVVASDKGWHKSLIEYQRATGYDGNSVYGDPAFNNAPVAIAVVDVRQVADCSRTTLYLGEATVYFKVDDSVEMDFDGILRKVINRDARTITFSPELNAKPLKPVIVANWADKIDLSMDLRLKPDSPGANLGISGGYVGSNIDITAYKLGDFNGDGVRDLPYIPVVLERGSDVE